MPGGAMRGSYIAVDDVNEDDEDVEGNGPENAWVKAGPAPDTTTDLALVGDYKIQRERGFSQYIFQAYDLGGGYACMFEIF